MKYKSPIWGYFHVRKSKIEAIVKVKIVEQYLAREMGSKGLEDHRGRRVGSLPSRTPEEELRDKIAELKRKNLDLQMENDLLKKVRELERGDRYL